MEILPKAKKLFANIVSYFDKAVCTGVQVSISGHCVSILELNNEVNGKYVVGGRF